MISVLIALSAQAAMSLDALLDSTSVLRGASYGVSVTTIDGEVLYARNDQLRLMPASNQKLLSAAYAAHYLGLEYRPVTTVTEREDAIGVSSPGDPSLTTAKLREAGKRLKSRNKPVYVTQAFAVGVPSGWEADDLINRYAAPVYAFTVDQGAFRVESVLGVIQPLPSELGVSMIRGAVTGPLRVSYSLDNQKVRIDGKLGSDTKTLETLALRKPDQSAARFFGTTKRDGPLPKSNLGTNAFEILGDPMPKLLADCLQPSDNQYAEQLLLMTAAKRGLIKDPKQAYSPARADLLAFLENTVGVVKGDFRPMDGSGLARQNLVTARGLSKLLQWSANQSWFPDYDAGLAYPGGGTLRSRLAGSSFRGKTGTLTGVVGLSGYVQSSTGQRLIVSIVINNTVDTSAKVRDLADQIVRWVETTPTFGPGLDYSEGYERSPLQNLFPYSSSAPAAGYRVSGLGDDRRTSLPWPDRRDESDHEADHRDKRALVCVR